VEGRFSKGNSVCSGHVKFELLVGHLSETGRGNLELSGEAWLVSCREREAGPGCRAAQTPLWSCRDREPGENRLTGQVPAKEEPVNKSQLSSTAKCKGTQRREILGLGAVPGGFCV